MVGAAEAATHDQLHQIHAIATYQEGECGQPLSLIY
jgi:hypothetical protein